MRTKRLLLLSTLVCCGGAFGALTNHAEYVDQDWSTNMVITMAKSDGSATNTVGFSILTAEGGVAPLVTNGVLQITLEGATNKTTQLNSGSLNSYVFSRALKYIVTTRLNVVQFPDSIPMAAGDGGVRGINIMDIRGVKRANVHLEPDSIWVQTAWKWQKAADVATAEGTYYTWQFEVDQYTGTVDIFRREADADPWTTIATNIAIDALDAVDQYIMYPVRYNGDNTQRQGILESEYLQIGDGDYVQAGPDVPAPDASYTTWVNQDWTAGINIYMPVATNSAVTNKVGFYTEVAIDGVVPMAFAGKLFLSTEGASSGKTQLGSGSLNNYEFSVATNYNVTTRLAVEQFPDSISVADGAFNVGINLFDIRGMDRAYVHLEQDAIWVQDANGAWAKAADIETVEGTYYTWQFEVHQDPAGISGSMDIFRRTSDVDVWTTVATNVAIKDQAVDPTQFLMYPIFYNGNNGQTQAVVSVDYLQVGYPSTGGLYALWADSFGLTGDDALPTADVEPDGMDNLTEYALGGDPTVDDAAAVLPTSGTISEGGTSWFEYVYNRRKDYLVRSLEYKVETVNDLVYSDWTNANYSVSGIGSVDDHFEAVTNRVDTGLESSSFMRLLIQGN